MSLQQKKGNLYVLAKQAKNRLKNFRKNGDTYKQVYQVKQCSFTSKDEQMYKKVCKILESDTIVTNPIMELVDKVYYNSLPIQSRQRYIFELTDKYKQMKERYQREKNSQYNYAANY